MLLWGTTTWQLRQLDGRCCALCHRPCAVLRPLSVQVAVYLIIGPFFK